MKKSKIKINYANLSSLDIVHCAGRSPFAFITRWVTSGFKNVLNHDVSVHTGILIKVYGQFLIAEMQPKGLELNSLEKYTTVGGKRWVVNITRNHFHYPNLIEKQIALDLRRTIEYDYKGLLEFVFKKVEDDNSKDYCSEYVYGVTGEQIKYPDKFETKVSPKNLQDFNKDNSVDWRM